MEKEQKQKWQYLLDIVNECIEPFNIKIFVEENGGSSYNIEIDDNSDIFRVDYEQDILEENLQHKISELWETIKRNLSERFSEFIGFRKIHGDNHEDPALIWSFSDVDLYFLPQTGVFDSSFEWVKDINDYEDVAGTFYVRTFDYVDAYWDVTLHDVFGEEN